MDEDKYKEYLKQSLVKYIARVYSNPDTSQIKYSKAIRSIDIRKKSEDKHQEIKVYEADAANIQYSTRLKPVSLENMISSMSESFSQMVFRKLTEKGMSDVECYTRAGIDRKLFSKMRSYSYKPSKSTAILIAITLGLSIFETEALLKKAGYALSNSIMSEVIVRFYICSTCYDIDLINESLIEHNQKPL